MKTGKVAKAFAVDRKTISNWTDMPQLQKFFTPGALGIDRTQRDYTEYDLLVLNTIRARRTSGDNWEQIVEALENQDLEREMPPSAMLVETTMPLAQFGRMVELQSALESAQVQNAEMREQIKQLQTELNGKEKQHQEEIRQVLREAHEHESKLQREIGKLEAMLEMAQKGRK